MPAVRLINRLLTDHDVDFQINPPNLVATQEHVPIAVSNVLETFDVNGVHAVWIKAIARRNSEPEGAITLARTLLETVIKRILDECDET